MNARTLTFFISLTATLSSYAQILPAPGAKLNYTQVMFDYPKVSGAAIYLVRVMEIEDSTTSRTENCLNEQTDSATATQVTDLQFGRKYRWQYAGIIPGHEPVWNGPYNFEITKDTLIDKNIMSLQVTQNDSTDNAGGLIINDCTHTIVDRTGKIVWYLANIKWKFNLPIPTATDEPQAKAQILVNKANESDPKFEVKPAIYDLRLTPFGTITCLEEWNAADQSDSAGNVSPIERNLKCDTIWKAPRGGTRVSRGVAENYNHDFKRLPNGHYMVLGDELWRKLPPYTDTLAFKKKYPAPRVTKGIIYGRVEFGTVIEYDKKGKIVWSWNGEQYFDSDALSPVNDNPTFNMRQRPHVNAFSIDRKNEFVYVGFRDMSRIVKIEKATGKVVDSWGENSPAGSANRIVNFHQQHDANVLDNGNIAVFNNNDYPGRDSIPSVIIFSQKPTDSGYVVWKYDLDLDAQTRRLGRTGGNVDLLKNGNYLVCLGNVDKMIEVTPDKKIVWQAEIKPNQKRSFNYFHRLYRAHYVSSLYPCYFTFQTSKDTVAKESGQFNIRLFNKGSEPDAYRVKVTSTSGAILQQFLVDTVQPGRSVTMNIKPAKPLRGSEKIVVTVTSQTNPDFERSNWVWVQ